jgi:Family of unknown function (DUF5984)
MTLKFKLSSLDDITLFGDKSNLSVNWFSLTDGDLWIDFGKDIFYKYTHEAVEYFEGKQSHYNDYYISRFIEDFTHLFEKINESVPLEIFENICDLPNLMQFLDDADRWFDKEVPDDNDDEIERNFWIKKYYPLISWIGDRQLSSGHLQGGPKIWFFRHEDNLKIIWEADHKIEDKINMWTSQSGQRNLFYFVFEGEVKRFGEAFFQAMDKQVHLAVAKDWGDVKIDKIQIMKEHRQRYLDFYHDSLFKFDEESKVNTDWNEISLLIQEMRTSISSL